VHPSFTYVAPSPTSYALDVVVTRQGSSTHSVRASAPPSAPPPGRAPRPGLSVTGLTLQSGAGAYSRSETSQVPFRRRPGPDSLVRAPQVYDYRDDDAPMSSTAAALADHFGSAPGAASVTNGGIPSVVDEGTETHGPDPTHADGEAAIVEKPWDGYDAARSDPLTRVKKRGGEEWICPEHGPICIPRICKAVGQVEHDERRKKEQEERDEKKKKWREKMERRAQRKAQQAADMVEGDDISRDQGVISIPGAKPTPLTLPYQVHTLKPRALTPTHLSRPRQQPLLRHSWRRRPARLRTSARPPLRPFRSSRQREASLRTPARTGPTQSPLPRPRLASPQEQASALTLRKRVEARRAVRSKRAGTPAGAGAINANAGGICREGGREGPVAVLPALRRRVSQKLRSCRAALESPGENLTSCGEPRGMNSPSFVFALRSGSPSYITRILKVREICLAGYVVR